MSTSQETSFRKILRVEVSPAPPQTARSLQMQLLPNVKDALVNEGGQVALANGEIQMEYVKGFPADPITVLLVTFVTQIALTSYKELIRREAEKLGAVKIEERDLPEEADLKIPGKVDGGKGGE